jgi:hypothetical protein
MSHPSWKNKGPVGQFAELEAISSAIFSRKASFTLPNGTRVQTKLFKGSLYAVDHAGIRYVEQNPNTASEYAHRAREGARILWVIKTHSKVTDAAGKVQLVSCDNEWLGRIENGTVYMK